MLRFVVEGIRSRARAHELASLIVEAERGKGPAWLLLGEGESLKFIEPHGPTRAFIARARATAR